MQIGSVGYVTPFPTSRSEISQGIGKDDFLRLLITQLRYQDPLEPMGSQEFASQLAQFSSLEQLQNMNATLERGLDNDRMLASSINNALAATLIGREVKARGNTIHLSDQGDAKIAYRLDEAAAQVTVTVFDPLGNLVNTLDLGPQLGGDREAAWDGRDLRGHRAPNGGYTFVVDARDGEGMPIEATPFAMGRITGVRYENGDAWLVLGDYSVPMADVYLISGASGA